VESGSTDQTGFTTRSSTDVLTQRYRLSLDRALTEFLSASVGGTLDDAQAWNDTGGVRSDLHARSSTLYGRVGLGTPVLGLTLGADRREQQILSRVSAAYVTDTYGLDANWRPLDLPEVQLRLAHVDAYDRDRLERDVSNDGVALATRFRSRNLDARYLLGWLRSDDRLHDIETTSVDQSVVVSESDSWLGGRTSTYLSGTFSTRNFTTLARGEGGTVTRQQLPDLGLSGTVTLPATVTNVALATNPAVLDGNTAGSAGVNVGYGPAAVNDRDPREVGAHFVDAVTDVTRILVWFDRPLSPDVARTLAASIQVHASKDNQRWTVVPIDGAATPSPVDNRIEIPIFQTHANYLKVTIQPLPLGATTDTSFRDVFVTEVQLLLVLPVSAVPKNARTVFASATAVARTMIRKAPDVAWDLAGTVAKQTGPDRTTYSLVNGVSTLHRPVEWLSTQARVARLDSYDGLVHLGQFQWSAGAAATPIPTASVSTTYSGSSYDDGRLENAGTLFGRADWYQGVSSQASASFSLAAQALRKARTTSFTASTSLAPNRYVTLSGGALYSYQWMSDPDQGVTWSQFLRGDGSLTLTPAPALSATATVSRVIIGVNPTTFATFNANFTPLRGEVQLSMSYAKNLDSFSQTTSELFASALRWNVRGGVFLTVAYTIAGTGAPALTTSSRSLFTTLQIVF